MVGGLSRRGFLGVTAGAAVAATGLRGGSWPKGRGDDAWLVEPRRFYSHRGRLALTLEAQERDVFVAGRIRKAIVYNGSFPGPTLVADPGDQIMVRLVNALPDSTNLHTHGFHVSPSRMPMRGLS